MMAVVMIAAWLAAGLAGAGTRSPRLVDDRLDGPCAASAFGTAAKAAIELLGIARELVGRADSIADVVIADDVAGTHNHRTDQTFEDRDPRDSQAQVGSQKKNTSFEAIPNCYSTWNESK